MGTVQAEDLRALQGAREEMQQEGTRPVKVNARVVAATDHEFEATVLQEPFARMSIFVSVHFVITVPPLRDAAEEALHGW